MSNEPVAWAYIKDGEFWDAIHPNEHAKEEGSYTIPLYTHPAKALTDEAIITVADPLNLWNVPKDRLIDFARAILKKASEK
jgi:hypothetical protein